MDSTSPEMVDCDLLEAAKENVQPLASGRRVTALSTILSTPHALRDPKLVQERTKLRATVTSALQTDSSTAGEDEEVVEDPSPLVAYSTFVTWTLEHYPQGHSAESGLLELLEEATRVLKDHDDGRYRDELKYLKLWILYASFVEKPVIVYKFLLANDIGVSWGALYEEFALVLEREGRHKEADSIYLLGIARNAEPLDKLRNRHRDFQKRMMSATAVPPAASPTPAPAAFVTAPPKRTVLGATIMPTAHASAAATPTASSQPSRPRSNAPIPVFQDPVSPPDAEFQTNAYPDLGTRKTRIKENVKETKKMGGAVMKSRGAAQRAAAGGSGIVVYRDQEETSGSSSASGPGKRVTGDDKPKPVPATKGKPPPSATGIQVFKDEATKAQPTSKGTAKATQSGKSRITVFREEGVKPPPPAKATPREAGGSGLVVSRVEPESTQAPRAGFAPFQDEPITTSQSAGFVPFRDEAVPVGATRDKEKGKGVMERVHGSVEAEALRKDPLKNYPDGGGVSADGELIDLRS